MVCEISCHTGPHYNGTRLCTVDTVWKFVFVSFIAVAQKWVKKEILKLPASLRDAKKSSVNLEYGSHENWVTGHVTLVDITGTSSSTNASIVCNQSISQSINQSVNQSINQSSSGHWWSVPESCICNSFEDQHPKMKSACSWTSNEFQRLECITWYQDSSPSNGHQGVTSSWLWQ